ncbi:hypothetical protein CANCADRAFT_32362 [Tortispora caseinolytica NRRL Y-17796]|uniref:Uncharacterized protein n=1 Tax=Tortispora caseinolytica NRRL Y-17796 TaxID=767744 RepID=A0A1E4TAY1_9ASCO|nr:hypothetical protein CANCADRAFT_32362 [Tortispora caseinolytica NRRL Y-17796]
MLFVPEFKLEKYVTVQYGRNAPVRFRRQLNIPRKRSFRSTSDFLQSFHSYLIPIYTILLYFISSNIYLFKISVNIY